MNRYEKIEVFNHPVVVFGCGEWGKRCINNLEEKGVNIIGCCDNSPEKWGKDFKGYKIFSPNKLDNMNDVMLIIATQYFLEIKKQMEMRKIKAYIYYSHDVYDISEDNKILGYKTSLEILSALSQKIIYLVGNEKHREDFKYIFDTIRIDYEMKKIKEDKQENRLYIICENDNIPEMLIYNKDYIWAEDLFCILDEEYIKSSGKIPSLMLKKTFDAPMVEQVICTRAFDHAVINSVLNLHFCCGDWSDPIGNILSDSPQEIWSSTIAKIFRLSLINRTYSFCNNKTCVHLIPNPPLAKERMKEIPKVEDVPRSLEIGIDKTCNLFCKSCRDDIIIEKGRRKENIDKAKEVILSSGWLDKVETLLLGGQGEVFFSKVYQDITYAGTEKRNSLDLRTNGTLLNEKAFKKLKQKYKELKIIVSVDAYKQGTYCNLRRSHNPNVYKILSENLEMLAQKRKSGELDYFQLNMCVQHDNYKEIPEFINWAYSLGVDKVYLTPIRNWGTYTDEEFEKIRILDDDKKLKPEVKSILENISLEDGKVQCAFQI